MALQSYARVWSPSHRLPSFINVAAGKVCLVCMRYGLGVRGIIVRFLEEARDLSFLQGVQTGSKVHRTFCLMGTGEWGGALGGVTRPKREAHLIQQLRICGFTLSRNTEPYAFTACTRTNLSSLNWYLKYKIWMGDQPDVSASNRRDVLMTSGEENGVHKLFLTVR